MQFSEKMRPQPRRRVRWAYCWSSSAWWRISSCGSSQVGTSVEGVETTWREVACIVETGSELICS
jgi:hypothetical protein